MDTLKGTVERVVFLSEDDGYTISRFLPASARDGLVTIVGHLGAITPGEALELEGHWSVHPKYGRQFEVQAFKAVLPATEAGIQKYLGSGLIKGIGPVMAERITQHFGTETLEVIDEDPRRLTEVEGIGPVRVERITRAWQEQKDIRELMFFLKAHDVSTAYAVKIFKAYEKEALKIVQENPYRLAEDIFGIGFKTADRIALKLGLAPDAPQRLEAALSYTLSQAADKEGHLYLPRPLLIQQCAQVLEAEDEEAARAALEEAVDRLAARKRVVLERESERNTTTQGSSMLHSAPKDDEEAVYLAPLYYAETGVAGGIQRLLSAPVQVPECKVEALLKQLDRDYSPEQLEAVRAALLRKILVLTGGPGTGKTTTVQGILRLMEKLDWRVRLAAPTGRAAKRLSEATGREAQTIHRLLGFQPPRGFEHDQDRPLEAEALIVDEVSMVDAVLMNHLLKAVPPRAHLVLVGDVDQLPSVGPGNVLGDLIASGAVPVVRLTRIFRQAQRSRIIVNAHRINQGQMPMLKAEARSDFFFLEEEDPEQAAELVVELVARRLPGHYGLDPLEDIQVLVPMYRGALGADSLNRLLQERLNPGKPLELPYAGRRFRVGDKVMQIHNNYDKEVFNGDIGRILSVDREEQLVVVDFPERGAVTYEPADLNELVPAYAITVHKSQGSEYSAVVLPLHTQHYVMLQRNLLYTALTRAKELAVLVGTKRALGIAVHNAGQRKRFTRLAERV